MIVDWPQNIGGKPSFTLIENLPAFVPVIFELTVFFAAHLMVITFYVRSSLWPFKKAENPIPETTDDKFLIQISSFNDKKKLLSIIKQTDYYDIDLVEDKTVPVEQIVELNDSQQVSVGFVFHSRKYSDGSSNLRIQFTKGRGSQYAKNSGLRIFRKYWSSSKSIVSSKHPEHEKINKKLEKEKVIKGYFADIDPEKVGFNLTAIINLRIKKGTLMDVQSSIAEHSRVFGVYDVTGEWDSLILARFKNREEMDNFIKTTLSQEYIERTSTSLVLNTVKEEPRVLL